MTTNIFKDQIIKLMLEDNCCEEISNKIGMSYKDVQNQYEQILVEYSCSDIKEFKFKYLHFSIN